MPRFNWHRWVRSLVTRKPHTIQRQPARRPALEELETRLAPATYIWTGGGADANWTTDANWLRTDTNTAVAPTANEFADLVFPQVAAQKSNVNDIDNGRFNTITFGGNGYLLSGDDEFTQITLGNTTANTGSVIDNSVVVGPPLINEIAFGIQLGGGQGQRQFFTVSSGGSSLLVSGEITDTTLPANSPPVENFVELTKTGAGRLILSADNSFFSGLVTVQAGALNIRHVNALGTTRDLSQFNNTDPNNIDAFADDLAYQQLTNSPSPVFGRHTVVQSGAQLQVENIAEPVLEHLILNGAGVQNDGALTVVGGTNVWAGRVYLDSDTTLGATGNPLANILTINGKISDRGAGRSLTKEGTGKVSLSPLQNYDGNTYRGRTTVNQGILATGHSHGLGVGGTAASGTLVNSGPDRSGTLQIELNIPGLLVEEQNVYRDVNDLDGDLDTTEIIGFKVPDEFLVINGPGIEGIHQAPRNLGRAAYNANLATVTGALNNFSGNNSWEQSINLFTADSAVTPDFSAFYTATVGIGVELNSTLTINGVVQDPNVSTFTSYSLLKTRGGELIFRSANTYKGFTDILQGTLTLQDSNGLGDPVFGRLTEVWAGGALQLEADNKLDSIPVAGRTETSPYQPQQNEFDLYIATELLYLNGQGANGTPTGALRNKNGVNFWVGDITLRSNTSIGVDPDQGTGSYAAHTLDDAGTPAYDAPFNDLSQLTVFGEIQDQVVSWQQGPSLTKWLDGELVIVGLNTYQGETFINEGWVTIENDFALGGRIIGVANTFPAGPQIGRGDTGQPATFVADGAALHVKRDRATGLDLSVEENVTIAGIGISHRFDWLNQKGALVGMIGDGHVWFGDVILSGMAGVGAEQDLSLTDGLLPSELTITGMMRDVLPATPATAGGIVKLGSRRVNLQGPGTFTNQVIVREGVLRVQNDTALGSSAAGTTVESGNPAALPNFGGAALEIAVSTHNQNTNVASGIQIFNELLTIGGAGVGSSRVDLQACKLEYSIVSPK